MRLPLTLAAKLGPNGQTIDDGTGQWILNVELAIFAAALLLVLLIIALIRRRVPTRFSLRTLLIATTLVAVVLGLIVFVVRYWGVAL